MRRRAVHFVVLALLLAPAARASAQTLYATGFENGESCWASYREPPAPCARPLWKEGPAPAVDADPAGGPGRAVKFELAFDPANRKRVRSELRLPRDR